MGGGGGGILPTSIIQSPIVLGLSVVRLRSVYEMRIFSHF